MAASCICIVEPVQPQPVEQDTILEHCVPLPVAQDCRGPALPSCEATCPQRPAGDVLVSPSPSVHSKEGVDLVFDGKDTNTEVKRISEVGELATLSVKEQLDVEHLRDLFNVLGHGTPANNWGCAAHCALVGLMCAFGGAFYLAVFAIVGSVYPWGVPGATVAEAVIERLHFDIGSFACHYTCALNCVALHKPRSVWQIVASTVGPVLILVLPFFLEGCFQLCSRFLPLCTHVGNLFLISPASVTWCFILASMESREITFKQMWSHRYDLILDFVPAIATTFAVLALAAYPLIDIYYLASAGGILTQLRPFFLVMLTASASIGANAMGARRGVSWSLMLFWLFANQGAVMFGTSVAQTQTAQEIVVLLGWHDITQIGEFVLLDRYGNVNKFRFIRNLATACLGITWAESSSDPKEASKVLERQHSPKRLLQRCAVKFAKFCANIPFQASLKVPDGVPLRSLQAYKMCVEVIAITMVLVGMLLVGIITPQLKDQMLDRLIFPTESAQAFLIAALVNNLVVSVALFVLARFRWNFKFENSLVLGNPFSPQAIGHWFSHILSALWATHSALVVGWWFMLEKVGPWAV